MKASVTLFVLGMAFFIFAVLQLATGYGLLAAPQFTTLLTRNDTILSRAPTPSTVPTYNSSQISVVPTPTFTPTPTPTPTPTNTPTPVPPTPTHTPTPAPIFVEIDIKPGSDPNCFNSDGSGVIPVAILSGSGFDATQVDPLTVELAGQGVNVIGKGKPQAHVEDVNQDGADDLVVQIEDVDGAFEPGETLAELTGETYGGVPFIGVDSICIVPNG